MSEVPGLQTVHCATPEPLSMHVKQFVGQAIHDLSDDFKAYNELHKVQVVVGLVVAE